MKLRAIRLRNVKKFGPDGVALEGLGNGLSVLAAPNEFGKSTIFEAVRLLLHEKHNTTKQAVQAFVPLSHAVGPKIELDIEYDGRDFRITKQFIKSSMAQIVDLTTGEVIERDGKADEWISEMIGANDGGKGPTGLLWVEQGTSMIQPEGGEALLPSLLEAEVGTLVGGERARIYLERARNELASLVTAKGKPKAGPYKLAIERAALAEQGFNELTASLAETEQIFAQLAEVDRQLDAVSAPDDMARQAEELAKAKNTLVAATLAQADIRSAKLEYDAQIRNHNEAEKKLSDRKQAESQATEATKLVTALKTEADKWADQAADLSGKTKQAALTAETTELAWKTTRAAGIVYEDYQRAKRAIAQRDAASKDLARARRIDADLTKLKAELGENRLTDEALHDLEDSAREKDIAEAKLDAGRTTLTAKLTESGQRIVLLDGEALPEIDVRLSGTSELYLGDHGTITLAASDPADLVQSFRTAEENLVTALLAAKVEDIAEARAVALVRRSLVSDVRSLDQELVELAPSGLSELAQSLADASAQIPDGFDEEAPSPTTATDLETLEAAHDEASAKLRALEVELSKARETSATKQAELRSAESRCAELINELGEKSSWPSIRGALEVKVAGYGRAAAGAKTKLDKLRHDLPDLQTAELAVTRLEQAKENGDKRLRNLREERIGLRTQLDGKEALGIGERLAEAATELETAQARVEEIDADVQALTLLANSLARAQERLKTEYFAPVSAELQPLLRLVLGNSEISLSETYQADSLRRGTFAESIDTLSGGTREQVAVLTRLAFGRLMAQQGRPVPVFLDDALVYCDDARLGSMFNALHEASKEIQCIVLTCHERAFSGIGGQLLLAKPWPE